MVASRLSGRSLQEYLRAELTELPGRPDPAVLMARVRDRTHRTGSRLSATTRRCHRRALHLHDTVVTEVRPPRPAPA